MKTVIYHSADYDGIFCREIARKFLGDKNVEYIGWNFGDAPLNYPPIDHTVYLMDLPVDAPFGDRFQDDGLYRKGGQSYIPKEQPMQWSRVVWIDHHASSIVSHPTKIPGYRIYGVAACRLAWAYFEIRSKREKYFGPGIEPAIARPIPISLPTKQDFLDRKVSEPLAVRLAGEDDVWDKRDPRAETFQYGLRSVEPNWTALLVDGSRPEDDAYVLSIINVGETSKRYAKTVDADNMKASFLRDWEGLKFLCLNGRGNSLTFASRDAPVTGHDALLMFYFQGEQWVVSLYHAKHRTDLDLSAIAVKYGGGGHRGACGFTCKTLPFGFSVFQTTTSANEGK